MQPTLRLAAFAALSAFSLGACSDSDDDVHPTEKVVEDEAELSGPQGDTLLDVAVSRPEEARVGQPVTYRITIRNAADRPVENVVVRQDTPEGFEVLDAQIRRGSDEGETADAAGNRSEGRATDAQAQQQQQQQQQQRSDGSRWTIGTLAADEQVVLEIRGVPHREGETQICAEVDYDAPVCATWNVVQPELRLEMTLEQETQWICEDIQATFRVSNRGSGTTDPVVIEYPLPDGLRTADEEQTVRVEVDPLGAGESIEETIAFRASRRGEFQLTPRATAGELEVTAPSRTFRVMQPELELEVKAPQQTRIGRVSSIDVTIRNVGDDPAEQVTLAVEDTENVEDWQLEGDAEADGDSIGIGRLEAGESRSLRILFRPDEAEETSMRLTADARCLPENEDAFTRVVRTQVRGIPAVRIEVADREDPVAVGQRTAYRVRVKNQGSAEDLNVRLEAQLPETLRFVGGEGDSAVEGEGRTVRIAPLDRLGPGDSATWEIEAEATAAGKGTILVTLRSDANPEPVREEEPTTVTQ